MNIKEQIDGALLYGRPLRSFSKEDLMRAIVHMAAAHQQRVDGLHESLAVRNDPEVGWPYNVLTSLSGTPTKSISTGEKMARKS